MWSRVFRTRCWQVAHLEGCKAEVWKTATEAGRWMLVNLKPDPEGNAAVWTDAPGALRSRAITEGRPRVGLERVMMPHVVTCPVAKQLRERGTQPAIPGLASKSSPRIDKVKAALPDNVIPFRRRKSG